MKFVSPLFCLLLCAFSIISCDRDDNDSEPKKPYDTGVFITNEGLFTGGVGTLTHYNYTNKLAQQNVIEDNNTGASLGNILQSMLIDQDKAYMVCNNANQIVVTQANTMVLSHTIDSLALPRYVLPVSSSKMYISQWGADGSSGEIVTYNPVTKTKTGSFGVGAGPEQLLLHNGAVYVPLSGGFSNSYDIKVYNPNTDAILQTISLGRANPTVLVADKRNDLWVLAKGFANFVDPKPSDAGAIYLLQNNVATDSIILQGTYNTQLAYNADADQIYALDNGTFRAFEVDGTEVTNTYPAAITAGSYYSLAYDAVRKQIWLGDLNYTSNGTARYYQYSTNSVTLLGTVPTGIIPGSFYFVR